MFFPWCSCDFPMVSYGAGMIKHQNVRKPISLNSGKGVPINDRNWPSRFRGFVDGSNWGPKAGSNKPKIQQQMKGIVGTFLLFKCFLGLHGFCIFPNWLIKVPGHIAILFRWFLELKKMSFVGPLVDPWTPYLLPYYFKIYKKMWNPFLTYYFSYLGIWKYQTFESRMHVTSCLFVVSLTLFDFIKC